MFCPICSSTNVSTICQLYDDRYGYPKDVQMMICADCGHRFSDQPLEPKVIAALYTDYYQRSTIDPESFSAYHEPNRLVGWLNGDYSSAARWVPAGVRVLDIGCGLGWNVAYHAARGSDAHGVDADRNAKVIADKYDLKISIGLFDPNKYDPNYFDYVTMDQVIEHVTNPVETLEGVWHVLKMDGHCIVSTPNANGWACRVFGRKWLNWHVPYHQQFFSERSISLLAENTGFVVESIQTVTRSVWVVYQIAHLLAYPQKGRPSLFWTYRSSRLRLHHRLMLKLIMATRFSLLPQLLSRLFDAIGIGDNYLIVLKKV